ncbi:UDP-glucose 4-epimerase [Peptoclostridium litorale DSM 5388]|uniref:UDP-glucose 4-epimerase n=1 Tax=Peptoclostridium litorale DSM 5388 TaxID=1121324 RepID=A0A069RKB1_PEPLI|nr:UDP-glucose 4-epimerase GalE [Peptoclostridium litorale]KDR94632.1 UDP-glucose 4-epimerase GalE [Peptoclostridium litorale DSM 5388]SIO30562.1 UDP-glucose 4-epimerase [Peptoclostridium litorale DSM 5388]
MRILVTGGAGYIGSHTCVELLSAGHDVVIVDNFSNSKKEALERIREISGSDFSFYRADIRDREALRNVFAGEKMDAVVHFAGLKAVGESVREPLMYYENNIGGTVALCEVMNEFGVKSIVFSSSATVYGDSKVMPLCEDFPTSASNPYGRSKLVIEEILRDVYASDGEWSIALLRYFNPIGAHESGRMGEDPSGIPSNLMPYITQVAVGKLEKLLVFGDDYPTPDGTGVRDYIHVVDLARGHVRALDRIAGECGVGTYNLGTGKGCSVLELVRAFESETGVDIPYEIAGRRPGDVAICYADVSKAERELGWKAEHDIMKMCRDSWNWQRNNPKGYGE